LKREVEVKLKYAIFSYFIYRFMENFLNLTIEQLKYPGYS